MISYEPSLQNLFNLFEVNIGTLFCFLMVHFISFISTHKIKTTITERSFYRIRTKNIRGESRQ